MLKVVLKRISELEADLVDLETNQLDLIETKYDKNYELWQKVFNMTSWKLQELNECVELYKLTKPAKVTKPTKVNPRRI